ncbi:MAG: hypothetical protein ABI986_08055 [Chloroflexota bacterium]
MIGDYLRHNDNALKGVFAQKSNASLDKSLLFTGLLAEAHQWWIEYYGFSQLETITNELKDAPFEWYISSGWAFELFSSYVQRVYHDVDIVVVPRSAQMDLQKYLLERSWKLVTPFEKRLEIWSRHMRLELPRHQVHAHRDGNFIDILLTTWMMSGAIVASR